MFYYSTTELQNHENLSIQFQNDKNNETHRTPCQNHENHENLIIPHQIHEKHETPKIPCQNQQNNKKHIKFLEFHARIMKIKKNSSIPCQNHENHEIHRIPF